MEKKTYWCSDCLQVFPVEELKPDPTPVWFGPEKLTITTKEGIVEVENKYLLCPFHWDKTDKGLEGTTWI